MEEEKKYKLDLFGAVLPSILQTKKNVLENEFDVQAYNAFVVNRALSYHMDCVLYANQMNLCHELDGDMQYQYLLNSIRPMKRKFQPWQKASVEKDLVCVQEFFGYSVNKAKEAMRILSDEQVTYIKTKTEKGGVKK